MASGVSIEIVNVVESRPGPRQVEQLVQRHAAAFADAVEQRQLDGAPRRRGTVGTYAGTSATVSGSGLLDRLARSHVAIISPASTR
jgi:hypothetical protein